MLFDPSSERAARIDEGLRKRLSSSIDYLNDYLAGDGVESAVCATARTFIEANPVSPWVFGLYAVVVKEITAGQTKVAGRNFEAMIEATRLPPRPGPVALDEPGSNPLVWDVWRTLIDTDPKRSFLPVAPTADEFARTTAAIDEARRLIAETAPEFHAEIAGLVRMMVLARPADDSREAQFNGASTFFLWGAVLLNAAMERTVAEMVDLMVHEASHLLLFGLVQGGALTRNDAAQLYSSPLRHDPRPIDGIFHACFVSARVHLAISRMLRAGLTGPLAVDLQARADYNARASKSALAVLTEHAIATEPGADILNAIRGYWRSVDADMTRPKSAVS